MQVNLKYLAKSLHGIADEKKDSRIQLLASERADLVQAAVVLTRLEKLKTKLINTPATDAKASDQMSYELMSLLGLECRS